MANNQKFNHQRNKTGIPGDVKCDYDEADLLWKELAVNRPLTVRSTQEAFVHNSITTLAHEHFNMDNFAAYEAAAYTIRDKLIRNWNMTQQFHTKHDVKRVYYLSVEFLMGRSLDNTLLNMKYKDMFKTALGELGFRMEDIMVEECDAALGNGGLGRLAACFVDSLATMDYPAWGYGLRYNYGIFRQDITDGYQHEFPDYWLTFGNIWEIPRLDVTYEVPFYGKTVRTVDRDGNECTSWVETENVLAVAYDVPVPGFDTINTNNMRMWSSKPLRRFDFKSFNEGDYAQSVEEQRRAENITSVLYPNDNTMQGKELRLRQQYFFVCATIQDILRRFKKVKREWSELPDKVAIQLNDTHPTLGIAELQRVLVDIEGLKWDEAWALVRKVYSFTNHTVLPEAMEKWPVSMLSRLLPRHMQIIYDINLFFLQDVEAHFPGDRERLSRMSIIEENPYQQVRMAHLAIVGSHTVNGVAAIHSHLIRTTIFKDFAEFFGEKKFQNKTNGITPRRWLHLANPKLSQLTTDRLGGMEWLTDLSKLSKLKEYVDDPLFQQIWTAIKLDNKKKLAKLIWDTCNVAVDPHALFDIQVKRIHEYKRQFMNILSVVHRFRKLCSMTKDQLKDVVPRVVVFGGKAAPGYYIAKTVIKFINSVAEVVNNSEVSDYLKVVFIPDYNVSNAEIIIPASDISQHISTAGTEASGTSNMKFVLNGGLILGTLDGANIEIKEEIGDENIFIFGCQAHEVNDIRHNQRFRKTPMDKDLQEVISYVQSGAFRDYDIFSGLFDTLTVGGDFYLISNDFNSYLKANEVVDREFKDKKSWCRKTILSAASMGKFSSDRTIAEYSNDIWKLQKCRVVSE